MGAGSCTTESFIAALRSQLQCTLSALISKLGRDFMMLTACQQVMPYSTGCCTPLSNFEAGLNYKDVSDPAVMVRWQYMQRRLAVYWR